MMDHSKKVKVQVLNAFVEHGQGGNPAGVVLNADEFSSEEKQEIARKVGLSETAFVSKSQTEDFKFDFFTPNRQIAHCGHATIATFSYLKQMGKVDKNQSSKETVDGRREIKFLGDLAFMEQTRPFYQDVVKHEAAILKSLGVTRKDLMPGSPIKLVNTGNSYILVPVRDVEVLKNLKPDFDLIHEISDEYDLIGYYVFSTEAEDEGKDATARMFGPRYDIQEESGTGMAAGPLACYLHDVMKIDSDRFFIQQGKYMAEPSQSLIIVDLNIENDEITQVMAGGEGMLKREMEVYI